MKYQKELISTRASALKNEGSIPQFDNGAARYAARKERRKGVLKFSQPLLQRC